MNSKSLALILRKRLLKKASESHAQSMKRYFKEPVNSIGVRHPVIKKITFDFFKEYRRELDFETTVKVSEELLKTGVYDFGIAAFYLFQKHERSFDEKTVLIIEKWISKYVNNWAFCDFLCPRSMGFLIEKYPFLLGTLKKWTSSKNLWFRRCSIVSFVNISRRNDHTKEVISITMLLLNDEADLVQKGTGWALREAAKANKPAILSFLRKNRLRLPRTTLRYAIERFSPSEKKELMAK